MTGLLPGPSPSTTGYGSIRWPAFFKWQRDFLSLKDRLIGVCVGRRSGKSVALAARLFFGPKGLKDGYPVAIMAHKRDGCLAVETELIRVLGPYLQSHPRRDGYIFTPNGAEVHLWVISNRLTAMRAGRGERYGTVVIDEAAWCSSLYEGFSSSISPTLADFNGHCIFASTPRGKRNSFFKLVYGVVDKRIFGTTHDCNALPEMQQYYEDQRRRAAKGKINPKVFRQEWNGEFVDIEEALVTDEMILRYDIEPDVFDDDLWQRQVGYDLALTEKEESDFSALVCVAKNRSTGVLFVVDAARFKESLPSRMFEHLKEFCKKWHPSTIKVESVQAQAALIRQWQVDSGYPLIPIRPDKSKLTRFMPLAQAFSSGRVYVAQRLPDSFLTEITLFPISENDDQVDALVYAADFSDYWSVDKGSGDVWDSPNADHRPRKEWQFAA